ncbi:MAG TPA: hypothetical protein VET48_06700, partial [Steroidobacteraceae bacterium]|nr:hypothetical protein [Steroidobacteraceae bacterium]
MRTWRIVAALGFVLLGACFIFDVSRAALPAGFTETVLQIEVNGVAASEMVIALQDANRNIWVDTDDLQRLRLRPPPRAPLVIDGVRYFNLQAIQGASLSVDTATQRAQLTVPATAFVNTSIALAERPPQQISQVNFGAFANYEIDAEHDDYSGAAATAGTFGRAYTELGFFGPHGVITNSAIGEYSQDEHRAIRLESTWTYDFPEKLQTLRVGDAISSSTVWSRAARFGGVQWGSNFGVRPDLVTSPLLSAVGEAVVPSTVDVFINNNQVTSQQVPAGPF